jgi:acetylornithine deacetylase/succinyl-diaminopimelate desuccinylase-like protein
VATTHRGFVWTEISVTGVAAHGSRPHLGVDAIMKTGPVLTALDDLNERLRGREHPRLGRGFVHASIIHGGHEGSTIPDHCTLTIERRTLPGDELIVQAVAGAAAATTGQPVKLAGASYQEAGDQGSRRVTRTTGRPGGGSRSGQGRRRRARRSRRARRAAAGR